MSPEDAAALGARLCCAKAASIVIALTEAITTKTRARWNERGI
jgi:hypothetical protein